MALGQAVADRLPAFLTYRDIKPVGWPVVPVVPVLPDSAPLTVTFSTGDHSRAVPYRCHVVIDPCAPHATRVDRPSTRVERLKSTKPETCGSDA